METDNRVVRNIQRCIVHAVLNVPNNPLRVVRRPYRPLFLLSLRFWIFWNDLRMNDKMERRETKSFDQEKLVQITEPHL